MALDPRYVVSSDLEGLFRDKDTGLPLSAGIITFYSDVNRSTKKPVYQFSGSASAPVYTPLPNPMTLSSIGTYQDELNNNIVPYWFINDDDGNVELYYVTVDSSAGVRQFTREAWPNNGAGEDIGEQDEVNFIPNGQFLSHNDNYPTNTVSGIEVSDIAQGGWTMDISTGLGGTYLSTFTRLQSGAAWLRDFPRYFLDYSCTIAGIEPIRDIQIKWRDVNEFAGARAGTNLGDQTYTLFCAMRTNDGSSKNVEVRRIKNFGTGGSPSASQDTLISTITVNASTSYFNIPITFGDNSGSTVGTNNDDYVAIAFRPQAGTFDIRMTDFGLFIGSVSFDSFPPMTNAQMLSEGVAGWMPTPNPDGSDIGLPLILTATGMAFDNSVIGNIFITPFKTPRSGELLCDGSAYVAANFSSEGIPYSRLFTQIYDATVNMPLFGTGTDFVSNYVSVGATNKIIMTTNKVGLQTVATNGATSPVFTYATNLLGSVGYDIKAYSNANSVITGVVNTIGAQFGALSPGTSGMSMAYVQNTALMQAAFNITALTAAALGNGAGTGKYFDFYNTAAGFRMWFKTATETAPAAGGLTLIELDLDIAFTAQDCAIVIANAMSGFQVQTITTVPVSTPIPPGAYFNFYANSTHYYAWYTVDGVGADPSVVGATGIKIALLSADTAILVAAKTRTAINSYQYATPDLRGVFIRGYDPSSIWNKGQANNFNNVGNTPAGDPGMLQLGNLQSHNHTVTTPDANNLALVKSTFYIMNDIDGSASNTLTSSSTGIYETRPVNMVMNYVIKY